MTCRIGRPGVSSLDSRAFGWSCLCNPSSIASHLHAARDGLAADTVFVADTGSRAIRMIEHGRCVHAPPLHHHRHAPCTATIRACVPHLTDCRSAKPFGSVMTTVAGSGDTELGMTSAPPIDGVGTEATFKKPCGLAVDTDGTVFVADSNFGETGKHATGWIRTLRQIARPESGTRQVPGREQASFAVGTIAGIWPNIGVGIGLAIAGSGDLIVADPNRCLCRYFCRRQCTESRLLPVQACAVAAAIAECSITPAMRCAPGAHPGCSYWIHILCSPEFVPSGRFKLGQRVFNNAWG